MQRGTIVKVKSNFLSLNTDVEEGTVLGITDIDNIPMLNTSKGYVHLDEVEVVSRDEAYEYLIGEVVILGEELTVSDPFVFFNYKEKGSEDFLEVLKSVFVDSVEIKEFDGYRLNYIYNTI